MPRGDKSKYTDCWSTVNYSASSGSGGESPVPQIGVLTRALYFSDCQARTKRRLGKFPFFFAKKR